VKTAIAYGVAGVLFAWFAAFFVWVSLATLFGF
jgi:hypothetical protein